MNTVSHKENFVKILSAFLFILFFSKPLYTQITVSQSEFLEIFTPGLPLHVIDGESGLINIGNTAGANIYDFTFVDIQDMYTLYNFQVGSIPLSIKCSYFR